MRPSAQYALISFVPELVSVSFLGMDMVVPWDLGLFFIFSPVEEEDRRYDPLCSFNFIRNT